MVVEVGEAAHCGRQHAVADVGVDGGQDPTGVDSHARLRVAGGGRHDAAGVVAELPAGVAQGVVEDVNPAGESVAECLPLVVAPGWHPAS